MDSEIRFKKGVRLFLLSLLTLSLLAVFTFLFSKPKAPNIKLPNDNLNSTDHYYISPTENVPVVNLYTLFITTAPKQHLKYFLTYISEIINIKTHKYTPLFFAEKRVRELETFKDTLIYVNDFREYPIWDFAKWDITFNSWQALIHRYKESLDQDIKSISYETPYNSIIPRLDLINFQTSRLRYSINSSSSLKSDNRNILLNNINHIYISYTDHLNKYLKPFNQTPYDFSEIVSNRAWGMYKLTLDYDGDDKNIHESYIRVAPEDNKDNIRFIEKKLVSEIGFVLGYGSDNNVNEGNNHTYKYTLNTANTFEPSTSYDLVIDKTQVFDPKLCENLKELCYKPITLELIHTYVENQKEKSEILSSDETYINSPINEIVFRLTTPAKPYSNEHYQIKLSSANSELISLPSSIKANVYKALNEDYNAIYSGSLDDIKKTYALTTINPNSYMLCTSGLSLDDENYIKKNLTSIWQMKEVKNENNYKIDYSLSYLPFVVLSCLTKIALIFILAIGYYLIHRLFVQKKFIWIDYIFNKPTYDRLKTALIKLVNKTWNTIDRFFTRFKTYFLIFYLLGVLFDIFLLRSNSELITVVFTLCWMAVIIGYRVESKNTLSLTIVYLVIAYIFLLTGKKEIGEKASIWAYLMMVLGSFTAIVELINPKIKMEPFPKFFYNRLYYAKNVISLLYYRTPINKVIIHIKKLSITLLHKVINQLHKLIDHLPETKNKVITFLFRVFLLITILLISLLVLIIITFATFKITKRLYKNYDEWRDIERIRPQIFRVEPSIIYPGMKVIVYGKNFGWNEKPGYKIESNQPQDNDLTDLWTETKIIFTIPLHWKTGKHYIQINKPNNSNSSTKNLNSNKINLNIIPIDRGFSKDDDLFFEELERISKEARNINGYE